MVAVPIQRARQRYVDTQLLLICFLTFVIHLIGTLAYSVRIAGVRTRRIAVSIIRQATRCSAIFAGC